MTLKANMLHVNIIRFFSVTFLLIVITACGGGGGGETGSNQTKPTTITVMDGYIKGATVCVDKDKNGTCDSGEIQGKTDDDGKVTLNIPQEDVGKYPFVAFVPADAIDKDDGKPVGTAYTMKAPADQAALVSPLTTLVQHLMDNEGKSSDEARTHIKNTVGDPSIDYISNPEAKQTRAAAKIMAKLMQDIPTSMTSAMAMANNAGISKNVATNNILLTSLSDIRKKAKSLSESATCKNDMAQSECQKTVSEAANKNLVKYSLVPKSRDENYGKTECVNDNVTGLTWEGKTSSGERSGENSFTNFSSTTVLQNDPGTFLSQTDLEAITNSIGYVKYVNSLSLCGFTDWRLPTSTELRTLVKKDVSPSIDPIWFPDKRGYFYWTSDEWIDIDGYDAGAEIRTTDGNYSGSHRFNKNGIRLVRSGN